ncbi:MAG: geranylgeranyl reductase family protein [Candidatus Poseidoniaceae archaeon]|nr:geranylgeranyl reductase family protein [Candidatus Poseidoniaceae archaeon]
MHWQVVVVGAGPVGGRIATELAKRKISVLLLEEHNEIGRPFQCAGLVNPPAMERVNLEESILTTVDGAHIHSPSGIMIPVGEDGVPRTHVVCRKRFDQGVVRQALEAGAELFLESKPLDAYLDDGLMKLVVDKNGEEVNVECDLLIGADGAHSWTRRHFKMGRPKEMMVGFQADVTGLKGPDNWLEMYTGEEVAPGFFAWVIPCGDGNHRIGVWSTPDCLEGRSVEGLYETLIHHPQWKERFSGMKEISKYCGPVPCGLIRRPFKDRVMVIGDAAGMAKPTTGGGIGPGFSQVDSIIDNLYLAIINNKLSQRNLAKVCKPYSSLKRDQDKARALRNLLITTPSDDELNSHFEMFSRPEILDLINSIGEIEHPVPLGMTLLRRVPEFRMLALKAGFRLLFA